MRQGLGTDDAGVSSGVVEYTIINCFPAENQSKETWKLAKPSVSEPSTRGRA